MNDKSNVHQGGDESDKSLFHPNSDTLGKDLKFDDVYAEDPRWRVPEYLQPLPNELKGNVMYLVHAVLGNITVDDQETKNTHEEAVSVFLQVEADKYLREQLEIAERVLH